MTGAAEVIAVARAPTHSFSKLVVPSIQLVAGLGVEGDAHFGERVKHRSRVTADPTAPNLRQVHLIQSELFEELAAKGFDVSPGVIGENVATRGIDLLQLPRGTWLHLGRAACIELTGLRNPCTQLDTFAKGLLKAVIDRRPDGTPLLKAGVMGIVVSDGEVKAGDAIRIQLPGKPHFDLERV